MAKLRLRVVTDDRIPVKCEYDSLNRLMADAYLCTILKQAVAYTIELDGETVGGCMIRFVSIDDDEFDINGNDFPACELAYLVIREDMRGLGLGTYVLKLLIAEIKALSVRFPIRFLILEAFQGLDSWYRRAGFREFDRNNPKYINTVSMRMDFIDRNWVNRYTESLQ